MIPSAIVAGLILGLVLRWWAVPVIAIGWAALIACIQPHQVAAGAVFGAANALVGVAPAIALSWAVGKLPARGAAR